MRETRPGEQNFGQKARLVLWPVYLPTNRYAVHVTIQRTVHVTFRHSIHAAIRCSI